VAIVSEIGPGGRPLTVDRHEREIRQAVGQGCLGCALLVRTRIRRSGAIVGPQAPVFGVPLLRVSYRREVAIPSVPERAGE